MTSASRDRDSLSSGLITSTFCSGGHCVGVRFTEAGVDVVDTKGDTTPLHFDRAEWSAFVSGVKAGEFDGQGVERTGPGLAGSLSMDGVGRGGRIRLRLQMMMGAGAPVTLALGALLAALKIGTGVTLALTVPAFSASVLVSVVLAWCIHRQNLALIKIVETPADSGALPVQRAGARSTVASESNDSAVTELVG